MYDVIIAGGGPAGVTAGIYAARGGLKVKICEKQILGGQIVNSYEVENYPGFDSISGMDLMDKMIKQAEKFSVEFSYEGVNKIENGDKTKTVFLDSGATIKTHTVIIATGASPQTIGCPGEKSFLGKGVSFCATCDGHFFRDKVVAVVGGGDSAISEALYLTNLAKRVYVIHRRDALRATKILQDRAFKNDKIEFILNSVVREIYGSQLVEGIIVENVKNSTKNKLKVDGVFVYVGLKPNTDFISDLIDLDENGYIKTNESMETNIPGIFAAGDVRTKSLRQVVTAASDGAIAADSAQKFIELSVNH